MDRRRRESAYQRKEAKRGARAWCLSHYHGHSFWTSVARLLFPLSRNRTADSGAAPGHSPATDTTLRLLRPLLFVSFWLILNCDVLTGSREIYRPPCVSSRETLGRKLILAESTRGDHCTRAPAIVPLSLLGRLVPFVSLVIFGPPS